ncbi:hypothetical protein JMJ78_0000888 [Colletotrichum scovillei]|nr:hypothetical protein JMJ78_0000888 [Colletotrichum scovillei]
MLSRDAQQGKASRPVRGSASNRIPTSTRFNPQLYTDRFEAQPAIAYSTAYMVWRKKDVGGQRPRFFRWVAAHQKVEIFCLRSRQKLPCPTRFACPTDRSGLPSQHYPSVHLRS